MANPSPEAAQAMVEARRARAECEASLPEIIDVADRVRAQIESEHFCLMVHEVIARAMTAA